MQVKLYLYDPKINSAYYTRKRVEKNKNNKPNSVKFTFVGASVLFGVLNNVQKKYFRSRRKDNTRY